MGRTLATLCIICCWVLHHIIHVTGEPQDICFLKTFQARCKPNEIILMLSARFGRMKFGTCVKEEHAGMGCSSDVLPTMDALCSGRQNCSLHVPNTALHEAVARNCPQELVSYLEVDYQCIKLAATNTDECSLYDRQRLAATIEPAYLPGHLPAPRPRGSSYTGYHSCPWVIQAAPGQRLNISLLNFAPSPRDTSLCEGVSLKLRDDTKSLPSMPLCSFTARDSSLILSESNTMGLELSYQGAERSNLSFIIRYSALGCADITGIPNAVIVRYNDTTVVKCNHTSETFNLACAGNHWKGELGNCTRTPLDGTKPMVRHSFPYGLLIVIGIGVALGVAVGICLLFGILFFLRRRNVKQHVRSHTTDPLLHSDVTPQESEDNPHCIYAERRLLGTAGLSKEMLCQHSLATLSRLPHHPAIAQLQPSKHQIYESTEMRTRTLPLREVGGGKENARQSSCGVLMTPQSQHGTPAHSQRYQDNALPPPPPPLPEADLITHQSPSGPCTLRRASSPTPCDNGGRHHDVSGDPDEMQTSFITFKPLGSPHKCRNSDSRASLDLIKDSQPYRQLNPENLVLECTCTLRPGQKQIQHVHPLKVEQGCQDKTA